ncbi:MAG: DMT family transporter [Propionivibrio sp.]
MLVVIVSMAVCYPLIKAGLVFAPPLRFAAVRTMLGGFVLLLVLAIRRKPLWPRARLARWILPLGVLATTLTFGTMFASPAYTGAGLASVLGNTQPLIIIALAALFLGERIGLRKAFALLLGLVGVTLLALPAWREPAGNDFFGILLALGSSLSAAIASVTMKRLQPGENLMSLTAWQLVVGGGLLLAVSALFEMPQSIVWNGTFVGILLILALVGTALSTWLWFWLLQRAEAGRLSMVLFLVPVLGLIAAMLSFGERLSVLQLGGVALILLAVAWSMFSVRTVTSTGPIDPADNI